MQKSWTIAHDFNRFWTVFHPSLIMLIFKINYILVFFGQKSWTIGHDFDRFWTVFHPSLIYANFWKELDFGPF